MKCRQRTAKPRYQVGTSGYMVTRKKWEKLACLNCIEINSSFYRTPSKTFISSLLALPKHINIVMKAPKYLTHIKRLKDPLLGWNPFWNAIKPLGERLSCVLLQLPPSFAKSDMNVDRIVSLHKIVPSNVNVAVEFRNATWLNDDTYALFRRLKWAVVGTYIIKRPTTKWVGDMPPGLYMPPKTASYNYLRVHGKKGWKGELDARQLMQIRQAMGAQAVKRSFVMFNNSFFDDRSKSCTADGINIKSAAVCNAIDFTRLVPRRKTRRFREV